MGGSFQDSVGKPEEVIDVKDSTRLKGDVIGPRLARQTGPLPTIGEMQQELRYHLNGNEVHFHADAEGIKVAIPVAEWWKAIEQARNGRVDRYRYIDHTNGTMLEVSVGVNANGEFDVLPAVSKVSTGVGPTLSKLMTFTSHAQQGEKKTP